MNTTLKWALTGLALGVILYVLLGCATNGNGLISDKTTIYGGEIVVYDGNGHKTTVPVKGNEK